MRISDHTLNRLTILKAIQRHAPLARSDLPGLTGLSAGLITQQTADLLARGLIIECKEPVRGTGRPRTMLEINGDNAIVIAVNILGDNAVTAAFVNLSGDLLHSTRIPYAAPSTLGEHAEALATALQQAIAESPFAAEQIGRVAIGLPAVLDSHKGNVHQMVTFPVAVTPYAGPISQALGLPVTIENHMVCMARAEHWFGHARDYDTFTMINIGDSIRSAEYADGLPKYGSNGLNSEFGHVKTGLGGERRPCVCGGAGCLNGYASEHGILNAAEPQHDALFPDVTMVPSQFDAFMDRAEAKDSAAVSAILRAGTHLGIAVANLLNTCDPGMVFIAVDNARFMAMLETPFRAALTANSLQGVLPQTRIKFFKTSVDWRQSGTAALALEQTYLDDPRNRIRGRKRDKGVMDAA